MIKLRSFWLLLLSAIMLSTAIGQVAIPPNSTLAMYVESGGKGIKFGLLAYTDPPKYRKFTVIDSKELNIGLSAQIQNTGKIDSRDISTAASGIADDYQQLLQKYSQYGLNEDHVYFYASSGLGVATNISELCNAIKEKTNHNVKVVKENEEAKYTIAGNIPYEAIDIGLTLDQGGSNTKGGYVVKDGNLLTAVPMVFDLGSVRVAELVKGYMTKFPDDEVAYQAEYITAMNKCFDSLKVVIKRTFENIDGAEDRNELYLSGGASFVMATLTEPEQNFKNPLVLLDINKLRAFAVSIQSPEYYQSLKQKTFTDEKTQKQYKAALKVYNYLQLISASKLQLAYVNALGGSSKKIYFNRYGMHSMPSILIGRVLRGEISKW